MEDIASPQDVMSTTDLFQAALALPYEVRSQLVEQLIQSLHPPGEDISPEEWEASWMAEVERRIEMVDRGEMETMSAEEAMTRARQHLRERRGS